MKLNIKNETGRLKSVVLGQPKSIGPVPTLEESYDAKSYYSIENGIYPKEEDIIAEMTAFEKVLKKYDVEVWLPSEGAYRELTSCSNYLDFASRRGNIRVKSENGNELVHTLNGTAIAIGRGITFLMERAQQNDGTFAIPEVLRPFMGGQAALSPKK